MKPSNDLYYGNTFSSALILIWSIFLAGILLIASCTQAYAEEIDMKRISQIESSGCKQKFGKYEHARGCFQITKPTIQDWNAFHPKNKYILDDMLNDEKCYQVAYWYLNKRIPQMLSHFRIKDTVENRIIAYNAGIGTLVKNKPIPAITKSYLKKYRGEK